MHRATIATHRCAAVLITGTIAGLIAALSAPTDDPARGQAGRFMPASFEQARETRPCIVTLDDGRRVRGDLVEQTDASVVLLVGGVRTAFDAGVVESVELLPTPREDFQRMRALVDDSDIGQRIILVDWLIRQAAFATAETELESLLQDDPGNPSATERLVLVRAQLALLDAKRPDTPAEQSQERRRPEFPRLTPDQINLIRVFELDLDDAPPLIIARETIDKLIRLYRDHELMPQTEEGREALYHFRAERILDLMFRMRARDLYAEVKVLGHPKSMQLFRDEVHKTWLARGCATYQCHGGQAAGRLWLYNRQPNSDATVYTNFLILERFRLEDGTPLINYERPAESPLLQMALPTAASERPHPPIDVLGRQRSWRPLLSSQDDPRFRDALRWIDSMYQPRPEYPVTYTPPVPAGAKALPDPSAGDPGR